MTLIGCVVAVVLWALGYSSQRWGGSLIFSVGQGWGGVSFGPITVVNEDATDYLKTHEFGHAVQNCYWGFLFPLVVALPSAARYWYREVVKRTSLQEIIELPGYYDIWFEKQASNLGQKYIEKW